MTYDTPNIAILDQQVADFFGKAQTLSDTSRAKFAASAGLRRYAIKRVFPEAQWVSMQKSWSATHDARMLAALRTSMDEVYEKAKHRTDFSVPNILKHHNKKEGEAQVSRPIFERVAGREWRSRLQSLPSAGDITRAKILATLEELVAANTPVRDLTIARLYKEAGLYANYGPWLSEPLRAAVIDLAKRQRVKIDDLPPAGDNIRIIPGGWIDLEGEEWDFRMDRGHQVRRDRLRPDVAEVAWPLLRREVQAGEPSLSTVFNHYRAFLLVGNLLGGEVADVRAATLEAMQRAWSRRDSSNSQLSSTRSALVRLFAALADMAEEDRTIDRREMLKIAAWLSAKVKLPPRRPSKEFLSAEELDLVITRCLQDIESGFRFIAEHSDLLAMSARPNTANSASPVVHLTSALAILIMSFTGLRCWSMNNLEVKDSMRIRPKVNAFVWRHPKKREENIVVTPVAVAQLLENYIYVTNDVRQALGTNRVFLTGDGRGYWTTLKSNNLLNLLYNFVERHNIIRDAIPILLSPTALRRTYATHQLYKGRSLCFIRAQLGHSSIQTTRSYTQFDRYEHPAFVQSALDVWGHRVLDLWENPVLLDPSDAAERARLFEGVQEDAIDDATPLPCATCENLLTGPDHYNDWEAEREEQMRTLEAVPDEESGPAGAEEDGTLFMTNYERIRKASTSE